MHESRRSNGTVSSRRRGSEGKVKRTTGMILVFGCALTFWYLESRFDRIEETLAQLNAPTEVRAQEITSDRPSPELVKPPIITPPTPSKNPSSDVTGASARTQKRRARLSDCQRVCAQFITCVSAKEFCSAMPTHGQQEALQTCAHLCERESKVRTHLLDRTGCEETSVEQLPNELQILCAQ